MAQATRPSEENPQAAAPARISKTERARQDMLESLPSYVQDAMERALSPTGYHQRDAYACNLVLDLKAGELDELTIDQRDFVAVELSNTILDNALQPYLSELCDIANPETTTLSPKAQQKVLLNITRHVLERGYNSVSEPDFKQRLADYAQQIGTITRTNSQFATLIQNKLVWTNSRKRTAIQLAGHFIASPHNKLSNTLNSGVCNGVMAFQEDAEPAIARQVHLSVLQIATSPQRAFVHSGFAKAQEKIAADLNSVMLPVKLQALTDLETVLTLPLHETRALEATRYRKTLLSLLSDKTSCNSEQAKRCCQTAKEAGRPVLYTQDERTDLYSRLFLYPGDYAITALTRFLAIGQSEEIVAEFYEAMAREMADLAHEEKTGKPPRDPALASSGMLEKIGMIVEQAQLDDYQGGGLVVSHVGKKRKPVVMVVGSTAENTLVLFQHQISPLTHFSEMIAAGPGNHCPNTEKGNRKFVLYTELSAVIGKAGAVADQMPPRQCLAEYFVMRGVTPATAATSLAHPASRAG